MDWAISTRAVAKAYMEANPKVRAHARKATEATLNHNKKTATWALGHREFLEKVRDGKLEFRWAGGKRRSMPSRSRSFDSRPGRF